MEGDRNTRFFHNSATRQKRRNVIHEVVDLAGVSYTDYFSSIFTSTIDVDVVSCELDDVLSAITSRLSNIDKTSLLIPFTAKYVKLALDSMYLNKTPGPNSMTAVFYKKHWNIIGDDVASAALCVLNEGESPLFLKLRMLFVLPILDQLPYAM